MSFSPAKPALHYKGPAGGVSGGLEAARSEGVLGFDGIKMIEWLINCVHSYLPCKCKQYNVQAIKGSVKQLRSLAKPKNSIIQSINISQKS